MKLYLSLVAILLAHAVGASTEPRQFLRAIEDDENSSSIQRLLSWPPWGTPKVDVCRIDSTSPITTFTTIEVKRNKVAGLVAGGGYARGTCKKNCDTICGPGSSCNSGQCEGICSLPTCSERQRCECQCGNSPSRKLTYPREKKIKMCHVESMNPTRFRTINVRKSKLGKRLALGDKRGSCSKHCDTLCPGEFCNVESGICGEEEPAPQCILPDTPTGTCPGKQCTCQCIDTVNGVA